MVFGIVHQVTDSYRPAILALIVFFVLGGLLLAKVDPKRGIREAGQPAPAGGLSRTRTVAKRRAAPAVTARESFAGRPLKK